MIAARDEQHAVLHAPRAGFDAKSFAARQCRKR
jgi:hypothetical protein